MVDSVGKENAQSEQELQLEGFRQVFRDYLKPQVSKKDPRMISVGCQFGYEADPFLQLFPEGTYLGIDIDNKMINAARRLHVPSPQASFDTRDARNMDSFGEDKWDVVFLGHPQTQGSFIGSGSVNDWEKIIYNSTKILTEAGTILATTHTPQEAKLVERYLKNAGLRVFYAANPKPVIRSVNADIIIGRK